MYLERKTDVFYKVAGEYHKYDLPNEHFGLSFHVTFPCMTCI